ncbi:hypothetical protein DL93DRAFT_2166891 [Clavulina sp. PMI_390]|nr:hypothetical protein DL93DRAFT_2166891 [Clavulina sp. PMI_390]
MSALISYIPRQLCVLVLVTPTTRVQRLIAFAVIFVTGTWSLIRIIDEPGFKGVPAYSEASGVGGFILLALALLLRAEDPRTSITWSKPSDKAYTPPTDSDSTEGIQPQKTCLADDSLSLPSRVWWAYSLTFSQRLVGTSAQVPNIIPLSKSISSRYNFCINRFLTVLKGGLILFPLAMLPRYSTFALNIILTPTPTLLQRVIFTAGGLVFSWNFLNTLHSFAALVTVALHICEPRDWPDIFGAVSDAYTVRRAWGRAWHQMLRKPFAVSGDAVADFLGAKPRTFASKYIKLYTAFILSTYVHVWGDYALYANVLPSEVRSSTWAKFSREALFSPQFFISQAIAIMVEDHVIDAIDWAWRIGGFGKAEKAKNSSGAKEKYPPAVAALGRTIGYVWVFIWFCATFPQYQHGMMKWIFTEPPSSIATT